MEWVLILHNIRSIYNVGSIFRTADAAGAAKIHLTGYTPTPVDRFGRPRADLAKVALGAEESVPWEHSQQLAPAIRNLKRDGFLIAAIEQAPNSTPLFDFVAPAECRKIALILGNEVRGLSSTALRSADHVLEIPMRGRKESLNVSVTAGIALFALLEQTHR